MVVFCALGTGAFCILAIYYTDFPLREFDQTTKERDEGFHCINLYKMHKPQDEAGVGKQSDLREAADYCKEALQTSEKRYTATLVLSIGSSLILSFFGTVILLVLRAIKIKYVRSRMSTTDTIQDIMPSDSDMYAEQQQVKEKLQKAEAAAND